MPSDPLPSEFYDRGPATVARQLLGKTLHRRTRCGLTSGIIVEVEAYLAKNDSASHSYRGPTRRNAAMFGPPGHLYVYSIHSRYCLNAVTESSETASAVLIRALEPLAGITVMQARRERLALVDLARGPARLCEALDVDRDLDGWDLTCGSRIWIDNASALPARSFRTGKSKRIGVTSACEARLRFFVDGSRFVSGLRRDHSK
jgi:DNA-3-methyladenine glycosylase